MQSLSTANNKWLLQSDLSNSRRFRFPWIRNKFFDLTFLLMPLLFGAGLYFLAHLQSVTNYFWLSFILLQAFELGPFHQGISWFAYCDARNRAYFSSSLKRRMIFFAAPVVIVSAITVLALFNVKLVWSLFVVWTVHHLAQQNAGLLLLYHNGRQGEAVVPKKLELTSIHSVAALCFLIHANRLISHTPMEGVLLSCGIALLAVTALVSFCLYLRELRRQLINGAYLNVPAFLFWRACLVFFVPFAFLGREFTDALFISLVAHFCQYIGLNYVLAKEKYKTERKADVRGLPPVLLLLVLCLFSACCLGGINVVVAATKLPATVTAALTGLVLGLNLVHCWLDAFLWKFSEHHHRENTLVFLLEWKSANLQPGFKATTGELLSRV